MKDDWTDFEQYVFKKLEKIDSRLTKLEIRTAVIAVTISFVFHIVKSLM